MEEGSGTLPRGTSSSVPTRRLSRTTTPSCHLGCCDVGCSSLRVSPAGQVIGKKRRTGSHRPQSKASEGDASPKLSAQETARPSFPSVADSYTYKSSARKRGGPAAVCCRSRTPQTLVARSQRTLPYKKSALPGLTRLQNLHTVAPRVDHPPKSSIVCVASAQTDPSVSFEKRSYSPSPQSTISLALSNRPLPVLRPGCRCEKTLATWMLRCPPSAGGTTCSTSPSRPRHWLRWRDARNNTKFLPPWSLPLCRLSTL